MAEQEEYITRILIPTDDTLYYTNRVEHIVALYNETHPWGVEPNWRLEKPETTRIVCTSYDLGGVLLDRIYHRDTNETVGYRVMFAAFEGRNQRKGRLRACLKKAEEKGYNIVMVDLNPDDNFEVWEKVGFPHRGTLGFSLVATKEKMEGVCYQGGIQ